MSDILETLADLDDDDYNEEEDGIPTSAPESDPKLSTELVEVGQFTTEVDGDMSEARAREITNAIRSAATATFVLIAFAHQHNAHKALGYDTWAEYVKAEFDMSAQRSYQLLDLSRVVNEIETVTPDGTEVKLTEAQARDIKRELPMVTEKIKAETEGMNSEEASEAVDRIIKDIRDQNAADDKVIKDKEKELKEAGDDGYRRGLEAAADALLDDPEDLSRADENFVNVEMSNDGESNLSSAQAMDLYNFFNALSSITSLPEPEDFIKFVPKDRAQEINNQLLDAVSWINNFQNLWEE